MTPAGPIIHVVDDDNSVRTAVMRLLRAAGYEVRGYASAVDFVLGEQPKGPGCIVLDVSMPGLSGLDLQRRLAMQEGSLPVVFLSGKGNIPMSVFAIKAGAVDFLTKPVKKEILLGAVQAALTRDMETRDALEQTRELRSRYRRLTARERQVLSLAVAGNLNKQIAGELGTSERTVKAHRAHVMEKMQAASFAHLVRLAEHLHALDKPRSQ